MSHVTISKSLDAKYNLFVPSGALDDRLWGICFMIATFDKEAIGGIWDISGITEMPSFERLENLVMMQKGLTDSTPRALRVIIAKTTLQIGVANSFVSMETASRTAPKTVCVENMEQALEALELSPDFVFKKILTLAPR